MCNQCDYAATNARALKYHIMTHITEKPFKCNKCDFATTTPSGLKSHTMKHTGEKPHKCNKCNHTTTTTWTEYIHTRFLFFNEIDSYLYYILVLVFGFIFEPKIFKFVFVFFLFLNQIDSYFYLFFFLF